LAAEGRTVLWSSSSTAFTYAFEVDQVTIMALVATADRRFAPRVMPAGTRQEVLLGRPGGSGVVGVLQDLSVGGVGVHLSMEAEEALLGAYEVLVSFCLDGALEPIELTGYIRSRVLAGALVRYGIQFDRDRVPEGVIAALERVVAAA
jgi:hypothetical protein